MLPGELCPLPLAFTILNISISQQCWGRGTTGAAATRTQMGCDSNAHGSSRRRGWCYHGSAAKSSPAIGQDKPALPVASEHRLGSSPISRRPTRHRARLWPPAHPAGKPVWSTGRVPELRPLPAPWETSQPWQSTGAESLQRSWVGAVGTQEDSLLPLGLASSNRC